MRWKLLVALILLGAGLPAAACPYGYVLQRGNGWETCAPLWWYKGEQSAQPQAEWADRWGAIAWDDKAFATVTGMNTKRQAQKAALAECKAQGGTQCTVEFTYYSQCVAVAQADAQAFIVGDRDTDLAKQGALKLCSDARGNQNCQIFHTECSLPERIR